MPTGLSLIKTEIDSDDPNQKKKKKKGLLGGWGQTNREADIGFGKWVGPKGTRGLSIEENKSSCPQTLAFCM